MSVPQTHDVIIIGAGPAGIAAAIYLTRAGVDCIVVERKGIGGLLLNANLVENYPGFPEGLSGKELVKLFEKQIDKWRVKVVKADVKHVIRKAEMFSLKTDKDEFQSRFLIVATGTWPKTIELKGSQGLEGKKLFYELVEIPTLRKNSEYIIIGGGDAAFDYAINLASKGGRVQIVFRGRKATCIPLLLDRAMRYKNIRIFPQTVPEIVQERGGRVILNCNSGSEESTLQGDCVVVACGREPNTKLLSTHLRFVASGHDGGPESLNMFLVGDVRRGSHRQVGISIGDGISAAMKIMEKLREEE